MSTPDHDMTVRGSVIFPDTYSEGSEIDGNAASGQKDIPVTATTKFKAGGGDRIIIGRGTDREEEAVVASVETGVKVAATKNLTYNHTIDADTTVDAENADEPGAADSEFLDADNWVDDDWSGTWGDTGLTHLTGTVEKVILSAAGDNYEVNDVLSLTQGDNTTCKIKVTAIDGETAGPITEYTVTTKGSGYTIASGLSGAEGSGTGAKFDILDINNETPLSHDNTPTVGKRYYISLTIGTRTDGVFTLSFGGITSDPIYKTTAIKMYAVTADPVVITPSKTFDGTITISIKEITKILTVTDTDDFVVGETVIVNEGKVDEESYVIASIQAGVSLTMTESLKRTHEAAETVNQHGIGGIVEICWCDTSNVISKAHYSDIMFIVPDAWATAAITFLGCDTPDGDFYPISALIPHNGAEDVTVDTVDLVTESLNPDSEDIVLSWTGAFRDALANVPYIKLLSGVIDTEVDQGSGEIEIRYVMTR